MTVYQSTNTEWNLCTTVSVPCNTASFQLAYPACNFSSGLWIDPRFTRPDPELAWESLSISCLRYGHELWSATLSQGDWRNEEKLLKYIFDLWPPKWSMPKNKLQYFPVSLDIRNYSEIFAPSKYGWPWCNDNALCGAMITSAVSQKIKYFEEWRHSTNGDFTHFTLVVWQHSKRKTFLEKKGVPRKNFVSQVIPVPYSRRTLIFLHAVKNFLSQEWRVWLHTRLQQRQD